MSGGFLGMNDYIIAYPYYLLLLIVSSWLFLTCLIARLLDVENYDGLGIFDNHSGYFIMAGEVPIWISKDYPK